MIKRDLELLYEIGSFRFIQRSWVQMLQMLPQNLAEHTLRVIWIALIIARHEKAGNEEKICKMALVHDLSESRVGDANYISRQYTNRNEEQAISDIFKGTSLDEFSSLWQEYEKKELIEAKIVKDADNLDVDLELKEIEAKGSKLNNMWGNIRKEAVSEKLYTESAKKIWRAIQTSNPHDWHLLGKNRFNAGDWKTK